MNAVNDMGSLQKYFTRSPAQCVVKKETIGMQLLTIANPMHYLQNMQDYRPAHGTMYIAFYTVLDPNLTDFFTAMRTVLPLPPIIERDDSNLHAPHQELSINLGYLPLWTEFYTGGVEAAYKQFANYLKYKDANIAVPPYELGSLDDVNPCTVMDAAS